MMKLVNIFLLIVLGLAMSALASEPLDEPSDKLYSLINNENEPRDALLTDPSLSEYSSESNIESRNVRDDLDDLRLFFIRKKSAPRRIFIGRRSLSSFDSDEDSSENVSGVDKKNPRRHLFLGKRTPSPTYSAAKRHIQRIFIGKRGDIKRIFIG